MRWLVASALLCGLALAEEREAGKIMKPPDKAAFSTNTIEIIATAPSGILELNGKPVQAEQPFPNVFHATVPVPAGIHTLALSWPGGRKVIQFYSGKDIPEGFQPFRPHPPGAATCSQCHQVSRRGRFVFKGGCFDCHESTGFAKVHTHPAEVLEQCGLCHNAHGSTAQKHLIHSKETACKQCHN